VGLIGVRSPNLGSIRYIALHKQFPIETNMSILLAKQSSKASPSTAPFTSRGFVGHSPAKLSETTVFAKPLSDQFAYGGYKQSLEAFIWATFKGEKVFTGGDEYPIHDDYIPSVPIPLPKVIIRTNLPKEKEGQLSAIMATIGGMKREMKGNPVYEISRPTFKAARSGLLALAADQSPFIDHFCNPRAASFAAKIIQCIDLFLRVQTYDYKGEDEGNNEFYKGRMMGVTAHKLYHPNDYFSKLGDRVQKRRKIMDDGSYQEMEVEVFPSMITDEVKKSHSGREIGGDVSIAKPSPHQSSYNFGSPSDVPTKPGVFFPFFEGMNIPDTSFIRDVVGRLFFRNLGSDILHPKDAWKSFRTDISTFAQTDSGLITSHILAGCDMALNGQARLFLVFDAETYKGFCLLGAHFDVFVGNVCYHPLTATELRYELSKVVTRQGSAVILAGLLGKYTPMGDEPSADNLVSSQKYLAHYLELVDGEDVEEKDLEAMRLCVGKLAFQRTFQSFSARNIKAAIQSILEPDSAEEVPFYISVKNWRNIDNAVYQALARFGPNSFSFIASKGTEISIPESVAADQHVVFSPMATKGRILVYEKPIPQCVADFDKVLRSGSIQQDEGERAAGQRAYTFWGKEREMIAEGILLFRQMPEFHKSANASGSAKKGKGKGKEGDPEIDFNSLF